MRYIIDRLEEEWAVCEDETKKMRVIPRSQLPEGLREGDVLKEEGGIFTPDPKATGERREAMGKKLKNLFE